MATVKTDKAETVDGDQAAGQVVDLPTGPAIAVSTFRDKAYMSRVLIMPGDRQLTVAKARIEVGTNDKVALDFLKTHPDFELMPA
ncbi:hypothetical protein ALQ04_01665 [Pseudomonas cichorii]|uniref:Uncharacterized protein n=1 Tax=Pseudomonas cichorii TaxID=36746 RepID=A0A3M4LWR6_PSECI|nr:hypothetical protein [Pseudomonas cichorii]RMQ45988.1 hypothetical protein ALQ04_01665 [Pseudomonas cichorii]